MLSLTYIYAHLEPDSDEIRYIGKSDDPEARLLRHVADAKKEDFYNARWLNSLASRGTGPRLEIIAEVPLDEWEFWERHYIRYFRDLGFKLTNSTPGGEGFASGHVVTEETRKKISAAHVGMGHSAETRAKISAFQKGVPKAPEVIARRLGRKFSQEHRDNMRRAHTGEKNHMFRKAHTEDANERNRLAHTGRKDSLETLEKKRKAQQQRRKMEQDKHAI